MLLMFIVFTSGLAYGEKSFQKSFDPVPLIKILQDTISAIVHENYGDAEKIIDIAINIDLPREIKYIPVSYTHLTLPTN